MNKTKFHWNINQQIRAQEVRALDSEGKQIGVISLGEALGKAQELGVDVIEIAPNANPPVVKIIELGKFRYEEEKKARKALKGAKSGELKEIRLSPFIAENDYQVRLGRIKEFLEDRDKVKVVVVFKGRQLGSKQFGYAVQDRVKTDLGESINVDMAPKFLGRNLIMVISPRNTRVKVETNEQTKV